MDHETLMALGAYLNEHTPMNTCDNTFRLTAEWLRGRMDDAEAEECLEWLKSQGARCDCQVVIQVYLPARDRTKMPSS